VRIHVDGRSATPGFDTATREKCASDSLRFPMQEIEPEASRRPRRSGPGQPTLSACEAASTLRCAELRYSSCATPNAPRAMACRCRSTPWDFERGCGERIRSRATRRGSTTSVSSAGARHGGNPAARRAASPSSSSAMAPAGPARRQAGAADSLGKDDAETRHSTRAPPVVHAVLRFGAASMSSDGPAR
jgi:hypothetical protein